MNKLFTLSLVCGALALSACAQKNADANYGYETQAPYADERTVGDTGAPAPKAEKVFSASQHK